MPPAMNEEEKKQINKAFKTAYEMLLKHYGAATVDDFRKAFAEFTELSKDDEFLCQLLVAVYGKLGSNYKKEGKSYDN